MKRRLQRTPARAAAAAWLAVLALLAQVNPGLAQVRPLVLENPSRPGRVEAPPLLPPRQVHSEQLWQVPAEGMLLPGMVGGPGGFVYGVSGGRVMARSVDSGALLWQSPVEGLRWGPRGIQGRLFATGSHVIHALNPENGEPAWSVHPGAETAFPPLVAADQLVLILGNRDLLSLDPADGREQWRTSLPCMPEVAGGMGHGLILIGCPDGELRAIEQTTGDLLWLRSLPLPVAASPVVGARKAFIGVQGGNVVCLATSSGKVRYRARVGGNPVAELLFHEDLVLVGSQDNLLYGFRSRQGHLAWSADVKARPLSPPAIRGDLALLFPLQSDSLVSIDLRDGAVLGRQALPGNMESMSAGPPLFAGQALITATQPVAGGPGWVSAHQVVVEMLSTRPDVTAPAGATTP